MQTAPTVSLPSCVRDGKLNTCLSRCFPSISFPTGLPAEVVHVSPVYFLDNVIGCSRARAAQDAPWNWGPACRNLAGPFYFQSISPSIQLLRWTALMELLLDSSRLFHPTPPNSPSAARKHQQEPPHHRSSAFTVHPMHLGAPETPSYAFRPAARPVGTSLAEFLGDPPCASPRAASLPW